MDELKIRYASNFIDSLFLDGQNIILVSPETIDILPYDTYTIKTGISLYLTNKCSAILTNVPHQSENKILLPMAGYLFRGVCKDIGITITNFNTLPYKIKSGKTKIATLQIVNHSNLIKEIILEKNDNN